MYRCGCRARAPPVAPLRRNSHWLQRVSLCSRLNVCPNSFNACHVCIAFYLDTTSVHAKHAPPACIRRAVCRSVLRYAAVSKGCLRLAVCRSVLRHAAVSK